jgi:hypothetical protein
MEGFLCECDNPNCCLEINSESYKKVFKLINPNNRNHIDIRHPDCPSLEKEKNIVATIRGCVIVWKN